MLREDSTGQLNVVGLIELEVKNIGQLKKTIEQAQANRHIGTTSFNKASSRSHAIIQFKVLPAGVSETTSENVVNQKTQSPSSPNSLASRSGPTTKFLARPSSILANKSKNNDTVKPFRIMFIDLAGSERGIDAQNNQHDNRKEGAEINQSLLAVRFFVVEFFRLLKYSLIFTKWSLKTFFF